MGEGANESRRQLALDVWAIVGAKQFDANEYLRTGSIAEHKQQELPHSPVLEEAMRKALETKKKLGLA